LSRRLAPCAAVQVNFDVSRKLRGKA